MCGIAGLIHRGKSSKVGHELQGMLQALKHRGEDSTGYALYGDTDGKNFIMRFKVSLKKNGKEFDEVVIANNKKEAMEVALKNNPEAQALNSDWTFKI